MRNFLCLCSTLIVLSTGAAGAAPQARNLMTYTDHTSSGMSLSVPYSGYVDVPAMTAVSVTVIRTSGICELNVKAGTGYQEPAWTGCPPSSAMLWARCLANWKRLISRS
jgi:hypothetical protein